MSDPMVSLADYPDLVLCLHNDLWGTFILFDDTYDLHVLTQVIGIWRIGKSWYIAGKDHSSEVLVICVKIEETYDTGVVGIDDCPLNNDVLVVILISIYPVYHRKVTIPVYARTGLEDIITPQTSFCGLCLYFQLQIVVTDWILR